MKHHLATLFTLGMLCLSLGTAHAADVTYTASMKGIDCADCKRTISRAIGKIKGVKTIRIEKQGADSHRLVIVTDGSKAITRADATAALGKDSHYTITGWSQGN